MIDFNNDIFCHHNFSLIQRSENKNLCHSYFLKGDLRPKAHPCFYGIILITLRKKLLAQSFESVTTKLQKYKVLNLV